MVHIAVEHSQDSFGDLGAGVNVKDSINRFTALLCARIQAAYPDADVSVEWTDNDTVGVYTEDGQGEEDITEHVRSIAGDLYEDAKAWLVTKDETAEDKMKYTPGPWKVATEGHRGNVIAHFAHHNVDYWAEVVDVLPTCKAGERDANARLIAAAPDLLEACRGIEVVYAEYMALCPKPSRSMDMVMERVRDARAAMRKARGEG